MGHYFKWMGSPEQARELWQNKEALRKYTDRLRDLMMADPEARMTEDETPLAARIRAQLFNAGLRGSELIATLRERVVVEGGIRKSPR